MDWDLPQRWDESPAGKKAQGTGKICLHPFQILAGQVAHKESLGFAENRGNSSAPIAFSVISTLSLLSFRAKRGILSITLRADSGRDLLAWSCVLSDQDFSHSFEMTTWPELFRIRKQYSVGGSRPLKKMSVYVCVCLWLITPKISRLTICSNCYKCSESEAVQDNVT